MQVCEVSVFMKHLAEESITVDWERQFPVKVSIAKDLFAQIMARKLSVNILPECISFSSNQVTLADADFINEEMLMHLHVNVSFTDGSLYKRAAQLRLFLLELKECKIDEDSTLKLPKLECPVFKFGGHESFILIRECYWKLFDLIIYRIPLARIALSGTPGIGKTCFLIYFLWRLLNISDFHASNQFPRILFHDKKGYRFVLHENGSVYPLINQPGYAQDKDNDVFAHMWYLVDSVAPELTSQLNILLVTSPNENLVKDHNKDAIPFETWYMPLWTESEINELITKNGDSEMLRLNQKKFGNIRRVLFTSQQGFFSALANAWEEAVGSITRQNVINVLSGSDRDAKIFHHVIHVEVPEWRNIQPDFATTRLRFASEMAQDAILTNLCVVRTQELESLLEEAATASIASSLCGSIFEAYTFRIMQDSSKYPWRARKLVNDDSKSCDIQEFQPFCSTNYRYEEFYNGSDIIFSSENVNALFKARRKNYAGIDGLCSDGIFNVTVGVKHDIIIKDELFKLIEDGIKSKWFHIYDSTRNEIGFFFLVPWYAFSSWRKMQSVKRGNYTYADPSNLGSLQFELCQIAVEVPRPLSMVASRNF